jgi:PIN domain nuclease of toxin-antitoxin system
MRILVDTQCWLWMNAAPERLSAGVRSRLLAADTILFLSAASAWEIAIKYALGKLHLPDPPADYVSSRMRQTKTTPLAVSHEHALAVAALPAHHRDPFDRLIVAQARIERLAILTADRHLALYDVEIIDAV